MESSSSGQGIVGALEPPNRRMESTVTMWEEAGSTICTPPGRPTSPSLNSNRSFNFRPHRVVHILSKHYPEQSHLSTRSIERPTSQEELCCCVFADTQVLRKMYERLDGWDGKLVTQKLSLEES